MRRLRAALALAFIWLLVLVACEGTVDPPPSPPTSTAGEAAQSAQPPPVPSSDEQVALAGKKIRHVVYLIKENRTFDHMFGTFPGADGATEGRTCDGRTVPLLRAADFLMGPNHSFTGGLRAVNG